MLNYVIHSSTDEQFDTPPLVVLHGLLGSLDNWNSFSRLQVGRKVIALDMRNHGQSPHVEGMSYQLMVQDVLETLQTIGVQQYDLMGHSMGGKIAMLMALAVPEQVQKLIVVDIAPINYPPRHQALLQALLSVPLTELRNRKQADDILAQAVASPMERGFLLKNLSRSREQGFYWQCNLGEIARHYLKINAFPSQNSTYIRPCLFIDGGRSDYISDENWVAVTSLFPAAQRATIDGAGHLPHVETPEVFKGLVNHFL